MPEFTVYLMSNIATIHYAKQKNVESMLKLELKYLLVITNF